MRLFPSGEKTGSRSSAAVSVILLGSLRTVSMTIDTFESTFNTGLFPINNEPITCNKGISKGKLDSMIRENSIPYIKLGKVIRFDMNDVFNSIKKY